MRKACKRREREVERWQGDDDKKAGERRREKRSELEGMAVMEQGGEGWMAMDGWDGPWD
jgi:hypothetical protein